MKNKPSGDLKIDTIKESSRLVYRLMEAAKSLAEVNAYKMDDIFIYRDQLTGVEIDSLESAMIDINEAYGKVEWILKCRLRNKK